MTLRNRITEIIGGKPLKQEREQTAQAFNELYGAYIDGKFRMPPQMLLERLSEYDNATLLYLIRQMQSNSITGLPLTADMESQREYQRNESRWQWLYSPLAAHAVHVWTSYGLGEKVAVTTNDEKGQEDWDYAWSNSRLFDDDVIHELSDWTLVEGEIYLAAFHNIADGSTVFEALDNDEITEIVTNPDNKYQPLYYKREYAGTDHVTHTMYYPDYAAFFYEPELLEKAGLPSDAVTTISEALDDGMKGTTVTVLHIAHNRKDKASLHGWPILGIASPYMRAHKEFVESRLTVAKQKAMFVREFISQGGSRGVDAIKAKFGTQLSANTGTLTTTDTNPPAISGSNLIHNSAVEHRDLPMTTAAGDAKGDNEMFSWMALIGAGLFPTTAGLDTSRWATAVAMDKTQAVQWSKYQSFWSAQFRKMVEIVLFAAEKWGGKSYEDKGATVSIDSLSLVDFPGVVEPIASILDTLSGFITDGTLNQNAARSLLQSFMQPILTALGTEGVDDILSDDMLGIVEPKDAKKAQKAITEFYRSMHSKKIAEKGSK